MNIINLLWAFLLITATMGMSLQLTLKSSKKMQCFTQAFVAITKNQLPRKEDQQTHQQDGHRLTMHLRP